MLQPPVRYRRAHPVAARPVAQSRSMTIVNTTSGVLFRLPAHQRWLAGAIASAALNCTAVSDFDVHECSVDSECETLTGPVRRCENERCVVGCTDNHQCAALDPRFPICPEVGAECVDLLTEHGECYVSSGYSDETMGSATGKDLLLLGAFAPTIRSSTWLTLQLAANEINARGGLPVASGPPRPVLLVACDDQSAHLPVALEHLVRRLGVRALLVSLEQNMLQAALDLPATRGGSLLLAPTGSAAPSAPAESELFWSLGAPGVLAAPLYPDVIRRLADAAVARGALLADLKIVSLSSAAAEDDALAEAVQPQIRLGTVGVFELIREGRFERLRLDDDSSEARSQTMRHLAAVAPDIILVFAGGSFTRPRGAPRVSALQLLEASDGAASQWRPTYVLGPRNAGDPLLSQLARGGSGFGARALGITVERRPDPSLAVPLAARFAAAFPKAADSGPWGVSPAVYDAFYYLAYALAAAPRSELGSGATDVLAGLQQVTQPSSPRVDVGPGAAGLELALEMLGQHLPFDVYGSSGPADFGRDHTRTDMPRLYCIGADGELQNLDVPLSASGQLVLGALASVSATSACLQEVLGVPPD
jgi:hypothetical protein